MPITDIFSKRQKRLRGDVPDVYVYDFVPDPLRVQLVQILLEGIGPDGNSWAIAKYRTIHRKLCREYGVFRLGNEDDSDCRALMDHILYSRDVEDILDIVELSLKTVDTDSFRDSTRHSNGITDPDDTIREVNARFREHGVGYEFVSGEMIRVDSQVMHDNVVKPALKLLANPKFEGANDEFLKAHEHYRHGRYEECLVDCLKAFESTMKTICDLKRWQYEDRATAKTLIEICINNGLFPKFMQSHIGNLRAILESGVPTHRNKLGGHGQGSEKREVPESSAKFALHTTATNILFFIESI